MRKPFPVVGDFLNVDVELISRRRLTVLADELKDSILYDGKIGARWLLTLETDSFLGKSTPDGVIRDLCKLIQNLSPTAKREWKAAQSRAFNIGFESAPSDDRETVVVRSRISTDSLKRIANLNATVEITCYRHFDEKLELQQMKKTFKAPQKDRPPSK